MRKVLLLLVAVLFAGAAVTAQTIIYSNDFDALTTGTGVCSQAGSPWTTWSGATGGAEDPVVSDEQAYSGANSIKIVSGNDLVLDFQDKTTGRYQIEYYMNIAAGHVAYFNFLQDFDGADSEWATQCFMNTDGTATVDADGESSGSFTFAHDTWLHVNFIVDLDDDFSTLYVEGNEIVSWQWSRGSFGAGTMAKLDALNLYAWSDDAGNTSLFYIDDVVFSELVATTAPANLAAVVTVNNIALTWDAPAGTAPDNYSLMRNGTVIASDLTTLSYDQIDVYPSTYNYQVRAHFNGLGYSPSSNEAEAIVVGGVTRDLVLLEINTGTWCGYCPGAAMGADDMEHAGHGVAIIEYHNDDAYATDDCIAREQYYSVTGFPTSTFDGIAGFSGGSATESMIDSYEAYYDLRKDYPSVLLMNLEITQIDTSNYQASISLEESNPYFSDGLVLRAALTESHIPEIWGSLTEVNFVCRSMYPNEAGTALDFSASSTFSTTFDINTLDYDVSQCQFVAFVQHDPSKEVLQTNMFKFSSLTNININEITEDQFNIYPNPSNGILTIDILSGTAQSFDIDIVDVNGKIVRSIQTGSSNIISRQLNLTDLSSGMYFVKLTSDKESIMKKIQIQ